MAYKTTVAKTCANRDAALAELWTQLAAMGWTLVDGSCTPVTIAYTAVSVANDTFTAVGHTFTDGQPVQLTISGTVPTGLAVLTQYYVVGVSGDTFKLATTYNGTAINITGQGTGNHTITESYRVYSSNGESNAKVPEYVKIAFYASATVTTLSGSYGYTLASHTQVGINYNSGPATLTTIQTGFTLWIHGNKDLVVITVLISSTYNRTIFGHLKTFFTLQTALTASAATGSSVTLAVSSTDGFEAGSAYQIIGMAGEGRDEVTVSSITDSTSMIVTSLARDYSSGSLIGDQPSTFVVNTAATEHIVKATCPRKVAGLADAASSNSATFCVMFVVGNTDPDLVLNKTVLQPILFGGLMNNVSTNTSIGLYYDTYAYITPTTGFTNQDTLAVGQLDSGISSGSNTSTTFNDTTKDWNTFGGVSVSNAYANKVVIITLGLGVGQIAKIASNTGTELTLASGWTWSVTPNNTSQYVICNEAYRALWTGNTELALREGY